MGAPARMTARISFRLILVLALSVASLFCGAARAEDDYARVQGLLKQGQDAQALQQADDFIAAHPRDPQMRFIRAVILGQTGHADQAEAALLQLTRDYPELAEPYNNLAVLYAARGDLDMARQTLQNALRIDPQYATARENLGDVYAELARRAWQQAQQSDRTNQQLAGKIEALDKLLAPNQSAHHLAGAPAEPAASEPARAASGPQAAASGAAAAASRPASVAGS